MVVLRNKLAHHTCWKVAKTIIVFLIFTNLELDQWQFCETMLVCFRQVVTSRQGHLYVIKWKIYVFKHCGRLNHLTKCIWNFNHHGVHRPTYSTLSPLADVTVAQCYIYVPLLFAQFPVYTPAQHLQVSELWGWVRLCNAYLQCMIDYRICSNTCSCSYRPPTLLSN